MFNVYYHEKLAQMRQEEMRAAAHKDRLIKEVKAQKPALWQKLTWLAGDRLIGLGQRLKHTGTPGEALIFKLRN